MGVSAEQLDAVTGILLAAAPGTNPLPTMRGEIGGLSICGCDADDMRGETPFRRLAHFDVYLIDSATHCWRLVADPQDASGVVIAVRARQAGGGNG